MAGGAGSNCTDDKNGHAIATLRGVHDSFDGRSPDLSLEEVGGKAAWAFYDRVRDQATIVYDGQDVRRLYGLDRAIAPYEVGGQLIFLGSRGERCFVVYDGRQVGPDSACVHLSLAFCCEGVLYNPRYGGGRYMFWGGQQGGAVCVEMAANGAETEEERAERLAREPMSRVAGAAIRRSRVEVMPSACG